MRRISLIALGIAVLISAGLARPFEISGNDGKRLIQVSELDQGQWMSQDEIFALKRADIRFMDITGRATVKAHTTPKEDRIPVEVLYQTVTNNAISKLSTGRTRTFLEHFTTYFNRFYTAETGKESALWLLSQIQASIVESKYNGTASVEAFTHSWLQPSIIARITGADATLTKEIVILGAHLDSMNFNSGKPAPGADDNGSGSASVLEALRGLLYADYIPKRTIEFQWYAAEEVGLRGSGDIAQKYNEKDVDIVSMMNFDVTGYNTGKNQISIITDFVNTKLTTFLSLVVDEYLEYGWSNRRCGYACSDHASFNRNGYPSAFPTELIFFPDMHTERDTIDRLNFEQIMEFTKLAVGYAVELSQPYEA